tara:strand:+ start:4011 stop:4865 length:855 start_codon:yes stop_codon:yes gene_type:complete
MKNILHLTFFVLFLSSCAVISPTVTYEKTNASLIQKSIKDLKPLENLKSNIKKSDKIAIVGVEDYKTGDYSLLATLEDEIIKEFVNGGYKVLERDNDMVYRLFSEESKNYKHINRVKGAKYGFSSYNKNEDYNSIYGNSQSNARNISSEIKNYDQKFQSTLQSADKIISYRVIESGIVYDYDEKGAKVGEVEREARTILEVRLTDAKTSEILSAITLDGSANDFVKDQDVKALKEFSYRYYSHTLPKTHGNPKEATVKSEKRTPWPVILGVTGGIVLLLLLIGI